MKVLSVTAQKPNSTGSGVYLTELVKALEEEGHEQAVVAGINKKDRIDLPEKVRLYPVCFGTEELPYPIVGMSDEMPYTSTRYCDMTPQMIGQFRKAFLEVLEKAVAGMDPDIILCHHLYLLTAIVRERFPERKVYGFCHNTDLRQMQKNELERDYIAEQIQKLDRIFVLQDAQIEQIRNLYGADDSKITVVGTGYNSKVFYQTGEKLSRKDGMIRVVFVGKVSEKKGVKSLLRALAMLPYGKQDLKVLIAGGAGNQEEYQEIVELSHNCPCQIEFLGKMTQPELARVYTACDIFVLPSYFDGLPLTVIEALACGDRVVLTDLPGIRKWMEKMVPGADIMYITPPRMRNADEPVAEELSGFEQKLANALEECIQKGETRPSDVGRISWKRIACEVIKEKE